MTDAIGTYPFILVGPRDGEKTDFLLACALASAAEAQQNGTDLRNTLILCLHQMVVDQVRLCFEKILPATGGLGVNCLSYYQLMREAGYQGPPRIGVPPSFLRDESNRARLRALIRERYRLVLFDQIFEAFRYFPELMHLMPSETPWAGALTCPASMTPEFEQILRDLQAGVPGLKIRRTKAATRKYKSRSFLSFSSLESDVLALEQWIEAATPELAEPSARAWPRVIVMHRSLWSKRKRIAGEIAEYLRARGYRLFNALAEDEGTLGVTRAIASIRKLATLRRHGRHPSTAAA